MTSPPHWQADLVLARSGDRDALGRIFHAVRPFLRHIASAELSVKQRTKEDESDLVQQTYIEAQQSLDQFRGLSENEWKAWLRHILLNNLLARRRAFHTLKRDLGRETTLEGGHGPLDCADHFATDEPGPEDVAIALEQEAALDQAINQLKPRYRDVIRYRNQDDLSFEEVGARLGLDADAAQKLWTRAVTRLCKNLNVPY
jgi:RNA polymerase sigma-70 factor (ECF subfamily)